MEYVFFAIAGLLVGGVIAAFQQKRPVWVRVVLAVLALVFLYFGLQEAR
ncbi:hypothetical protein [Flindersiella endophytica]